MGRAGIHLKPLHEDNMTLEQQRQSKNIHVPVALVELQIMEKTTDISQENDHL